MRIILYKDNVSTGRGADVAVRNLAGILADAGREVVLVTRQPEAAPLSCVFDPRVKVVYSSLERLAADLQAARPDVVVAAGTNEIADLDAVLGGRAFPWPVVMQIHIYPPTLFKWRHPFRNHAIKRAMRKVAAVQVLMPSFVGLVRRVAGLPPAVRVVAIGNLCSPPAGPSPVPSGHLIAYPAALNPGKRQDLLVRAFARLAKDFPDWSVELFGNGSASCRAGLERLIRTLGLEGRVRLMGYARDLGPVYARSSLIAFPSACEGFPMTVLEAMGAGRAVVGCRTTPGVNELIEDGRTGLLAPDDAAGFASALARLMSDPGRRGALGAAARQVAAHYSAEAVAGQWTALLDGLA